MSGFGAALWCELLKVRRSRLPLWTALGLSMGPLFGALFMFIMKDPERARQMGLLGTKAQLAGVADWPSYFMLLGQVVSIGGLLVFSLAASWVVGREFADRTVRDQLALPTPRAAIVV
ncbi:MAG: ABC transporter permease, partial [candidate division WOR-3 bacterium]